MIQPLHQQLLGTFDPSGSITFNFPPVPQGLIWTGSISISFPKGHDPQGIVWTLFRNGTPFLSGNEWPVFRDVQAVGQEQLQLVGAYIGAQAPPTYQITTSWDGFSAAGWTDGGGLAPASPTVDNSTRGFVQVYNTLGVGSALEVMADPISYNVLTDYATLTGPSQTALIIPTPAANQYLQIWELEVLVVASQLAAAAGAQTTTATLSSTAGQTLEVCKAVTLPGTTAHARSRLNMHGLNISAGNTIQIASSGYSGSTLSVVAHAVYELKTK